MPDKHLIIITGPVGGGKSTVARHLADLLQLAGMKTAVIDLDELYCMARQQPGFGDRSVWKTARRGAADLIESFYASGMCASIIEGGFLTELEYMELRGHIVSEVRETFVTLLVSEEEALRRAQADPDPGRVASRRPEIQALLYAEFQAALPFLIDSSKVIAADIAKPEQLAHTIHKLALSPNP